MNIVKFFDEEESNSDNDEEENNSDSADTLTYISDAEIESMKKHDQEILEKEYKKYFPLDEYKEEYEGEDEFYENGKKVGIRKKDQREKLCGIGCECCNHFFKSLGLSKKEEKKLVQETSRHRYKKKQFPKSGIHNQSNTPPGFWNMTWFTDDDEKDDNN